MVEHLDVGRAERGIVDDIAHRQVVVGQHPGVGRSRLDLVYDLVQTKLDLVDRHGRQVPVRLQRTEIGWHLLDPQLFLREGDGQGLGRGARSQKADAGAATG